MAKSKKTNRVRLSVATRKEAEYGFTEALKTQIYERDNHTCQYCFSPAQCVDHVIALSYGRDHHPDNLVAACNFCNLVLGNKLFDNFAHKRAYMIDWYDKHLPKAERLIWTIDEIQELGYNLKQKMLACCIIVADEKQAEKIRRILRENRIRIVLERKDIEVF